MAQFNFIAFKSELTHRVNYYAKGVDISSPANFKSDDEAIEAAFNEAPEWAQLVEVVKVTGRKPNGYYILEKIWQCGDTSLSY